jgi:hypothetical protein
MHNPFHQLSLLAVRRRFPGTFRMGFPIPRQPKLSCEFTERANRDDLPIIGSSLSVYGCPPAIFLPFPSIRYRSMNETPKMPENLWG